MDQVTVQETISSMAEGSSQHTSVMPKEVLECLSPKAGGVYVDGTLGLAGHSLALLKAMGPNGTLIGLDRDESSLGQAEKILSEYAGQCHLVHSNYRDIDKVLSGLSIDGVDGILLDLGISSFQLDNNERGFSFRDGGPLDMRMDQANHISAFDLVNSLSEKEISHILKQYGEERWHQRIARTIVDVRSQQPIETTKELADLVTKAVPNFQRKHYVKIHPATRTFQAFRIAVNRELEALEVTLDQCHQCLKPGGRLVVIAFHSLEDRIVKHKFRHYAKEGSFKLIVKKPLRPDEDEVQQNPRARSARLRVVERI